jgi:HEAT repeat protein
MKRFLLFSFLILLLVGIGVGAYFGVKYTRNRIFVPISVEEMTKLQEKGDAASAEIPRLIECFDRDNEELRLTAAMTLGTIGAKAVEPVRERLKDPSAKIRFCAVESLAFIGPDAAPAGDDLLVC